MRMPNLSALFCALIFISFSAQAVSVGILVGFKSTEMKEQQKIHQELQTTIQRHFKSINTDWVVPESSERESDETYLNELCKKYLLKEEVSSCSLNSEVPLNQDGLFKGELCRREENKNQLFDIKNIFEKLQSNCAITNSNRLEDLISYDGTIDIAAGFTAHDITPLWGQEATGADLAYKFMKDLNKKRTEKSQMPLSVNDGVIEHYFSPQQIKELKLSKNAINQYYKTTRGLSDEQMNEATSHSSNTISLMVDPTYGVSPVAKISLASEGRFSSSYIIGLEKTEETATKIVNISLGCAGKEVYKATGQALNRGLIIVTSAGNNYDLDGGQIDYCKEDPRLIVVGSISPLGYVSEFSEPGENVTILAPGDFWTPSAVLGKNSTAAGTSAASPQVKGALDNVLSLLPSLNGQDLKIMLKNTATKTVASLSENSADHNNGHGLLNAYKLARVAANIEEATRGIDDQDKRNQMIKKMIADPRNYRFSSEADELLVEGKRLLSSISCQDRQNAYNSIRQSFLLNANEEAREKLIELHLFDKRYGTAEFYKSLDSDPKRYLNNSVKQIQVLHQRHLPKRYGKERP